MSPCRSRRAVRCATALAVLAGAGAISGTPAVAATTTHTKPIVLSAPSPKAAVTRGHAVTVKLKVTNATRARIAGATLRVSPAKGVSAAIRGAKHGRRAVGTLKARAQRTFSVKLTPGAAAAATSRTTLSVSAPHGVRASATVTLKLATAPAGGPAPVQPGAPGQPATPPSPPPPAGLAGRYFWRTALIVGTIYTYGVSFVDGQWAYRGIPDGGLPSCSARTAASTTADGCVPYTYDAASGALTVDGIAGSLLPTTPGAPPLFKLNNIAYSEAVVPAAGSAYALTGRSINGAGLCGVSCAFASSDITLTPDGAFGLVSTVSGSTGDGGGFAVLPPNQHGTYAITAPGRLTLAFADGTVRTDTFVIMQDDAHQADPNYGFLLDDAVYFGPDSGV